MDIREVQNYIAAFEHARRRLSDRPLSLRLLKEARAAADERPGRGEDTGRVPVQPELDLPAGTLAAGGDLRAPSPRPGDGRRAPRLGGVPHERDGEYPPLVVCGLIHYQFETIHPFLDGNGRLGRLINILYLIDIGELPEPLLHLSPYFERDRNAYDSHLRAVRERGEMQEWLQYFLHGVAVQAKDALDRAERLTDLQSRYRAALAGDRSNAPHRIDPLFANP